MSDHDVTTDDAWVPDACTLPSAERPLRLAEFDQFLTEAVRGADRVSTACAACCLLPPLLAAGIIGGAGWAAANRFMPGVTVALALLAGLAWWKAGKRPHTAGCAGGNCSCGQPDRG